MCEYSLEEAGAGEDDRVAGEVEDHVRKEREAREPHQQLGADR
jgi:hypothetical protein